MNAQKGISGRWVLLRFTCLLPVVALLVIPPLRAQRLDHAQQRSGAQRLSGDFTSPVPTFTAA